MMRAVRLMQGLKRNFKLWQRTVLSERRISTWFIVLLVALILLTVYSLSYRNAEKRLRATTENHLIRLSGALDAALEKHAYLPELLANNKKIQDFLTQQALLTDDPSRLSLEQINASAYLRGMNRIALTMDIYLLNTAGVTLASSNWLKSHSFVGKNFAFRPYFSQAIQTGIGRYFALGSNSGERGYYFSARVDDEQSKPLGVIVVKVSVSQLEAEWQNEAVEFLVTDADGIIFMTSRSEWRVTDKNIKALYPLSADRRRDIHSARRYTTRIPEVLSDFSERPLNADFSRATLSDREYLLSSQSQSYGWTVHVLSHWETVSQAVSLALGLAVLIMGLSGLLIFVLWKTQRERRRYEQGVLANLEFKVEERTRELKRTQEELVQAAKMAALGQLSSAINHEINNPLSAIRAYADNAREFLERNRSDMVAANLREISGLTERMATITRQLKTFSRKSQGEVARCDLHQALDSARLIMQSKFTQSAVKLHEQREADAQWVQADLVWLEQILINLFSNALDAVSDQQEKHIWLRSQLQADQVQIEVRDNGSGISDIDLPYVFEAFFTTKAIGKGLGLGLSISYRLARDMGGDLQVVNSEQGGAAFTLTLPLADTVSGTEEQG